MSMSITRSQANCGCVVSMYWSAQDVGADRLPDELLLERARELGRPLFTHDIRLHAMAEKWQSEGRQFGGVIFGHLMNVSIGRCVKDLELIAKATETVRLGQHRDSVAAVK